MKLEVETAHGVYTVDLEREMVEGLEEGATLDHSAAVATGLPRVVAAVSSGSTVVAVVDMKPPLAISYDEGRTWSQAGGGLPPGYAVAIHDENPDVVVFAGRNRLYVSRNGGRFWHALDAELPDITAIALA